ncbi:hypothetical protein B0H16DRAFT_1021466 [Mycena metata]|uniref:F-box domain-containing protein n=1 Tax=Mycena metata TaxID=1033252 RepID=A0AAD7N3A2_9AGAR|nr:hypothetical protein B0H16DRAFT_1021466 [Mycena metata]
MTTQAGAESTHKPLTQSERNAFSANRARIADIKAKMLELEGTMIELERTLSSLNEENTLLQDRLDVYTYPVLILPNEIVSEIFVHFLPVFPEPPPMIGGTSPNVLGQICRKWREISFEHPRALEGDQFVAAQREET